MTLGANSYGTTGDVAALTPRYANTSGVFDANTRPTLTQVERQMDLVSGLVNALLAEAGFTIPVTQADVVLSLAFFVEQETAAIVEGINGSGRFGPTTKSEGGKGRFALIMDDVKAFIEANTVGFERLGAARNYSATSGLAYRDTDERGNPMFPLFQRAAFGDEFFQHDWDEALA
jgi:hypothetical protein